MALVMKKQVVFIHGGEAFSSYELFIKHLSEEAIDPFKKTSKRWHQVLPESLGDAYEVFLPQMPNAENAKYLEWKIWFEKYIPYLRDGVILIGHSQGGYFLAKYLTENTFSMSVAGLYLVAAPFEPQDFGGEDGGDFVFDTKKLEKLESVTAHIVIFHSKDDYVVPFEHALKYAQKLKNASLIALEDRIHIWQESFPELIEDIIGLK